MLQNILTNFPQLNSNTIYLDSGASSLTPIPVLEVMERYYREYRANIHRGVYQWSQRASDEYEQVRDTVGRFMGAPRREEIIFTRGTTDSMNILSELLEDKIESGKNIILPILEHHSNLLPWREIAKRKSCNI
jgi:selenocysteine lyase/cysteine desulfurase